jgi:calcineurin-like phosphoesterase family protein
MTIWFTADHHFGHANIIRYCARPFGDVVEQDEALICLWNQVVGPRDEVWHLGDFGFHNIEAIFKRLAGHKHLVRGNHDAKPGYCVKMGWASVQQVKLLKIQNQYIWLSHYAHRTWPHSHRGSWHLFGHSHGTLLPHGKSMDVGVDPMGFYPVSFEQVKFFMEVEQHELVREEAYG